jgi:hypothetical protein
MVCSGHGNLGVGSTTRGKAAGLMLKAEQLWLGFGCTVVNDGWG